MKTEFNLSVIKNKPTKELTSHEKYLRYKEVIKRNNKKNYKKYGKKYFADKVRDYAKKNRDKIKEKAKRRYDQPEEKKKALVRAKTINSNEKTGICFDCKEKTKTRFHHLSYEPNIFIELCKKCHNKRHGRNYYGR
ncbi:MAG: hypothetical protein ACTSQG_09695 [Promethearchaeota archaeon]